VTQSLLPASLSIPRRSLQKVKGFVQVPDLFYAGSHGFDIWGPTAESLRYQVKPRPRLLVLDIHHIPISLSDYRSNVKETLERC
jgi:hypothetical protein